MHTVKGCVHQVDATHSEVLDRCRPSCHGLEMVESRDGAWCRFRAASQARLLSALAAARLKLHAMIGFNIARPRWTLHCALTLVIHALDVCNPRPCVQWLQVHRLWLLSLPVHWA